MFSLDEKEFSANPNLTQKIQTLIIGRLLVIFLLLVASWVWNSGRLKLSFDDFPKGLFLVFLISVGLMIVYFFVLHSFPSFRQHFSMILSIHSSPCDHAAAILKNAALLPSFSVSGSVASSLPASRPATPARTPPHGLRAHSHSVPLCTGILSSSSLFFSFSLDLGCLMCVLCRTRAVRQDPQGPSLQTADR